MNIKNLLVFICCLIVATLPSWSQKEDRRRDDLIFPGWPSRFEEQPLVPLSLTEREARFAKGFPGEIGRFTDGRQEIIIRWVTRETRRLHPAADCFKGLGYTITPSPLYRDANGYQWTQFTAKREQESLRVREIIRGDELGWPDISAWYWHAFLGRTEGPWWAITVAERMPNT